MVKYIILHNKHDGCYEFPYFEDESAKIRLTSITINPPKIFMFNNKDQAQDFFEEYINEVDILDTRCKKGEEVEHVEYCTCGITELDEEENPILFYNKRNQIFLLEHGPEVFVPPHEVKQDMKTMNLTNQLLRRKRTLTKELRLQYAELGRFCQKCAIDDDAPPENSTGGSDNQK